MEGNSDSFVILKIIEYTSDLEDIDDLDYVMV